MPSAPLVRGAPTVAVSAPVPLQSTQSLGTRSATVSALCWSWISPSTTVETKKLPSLSTSSVTTMVMSLPLTPGYLAVAVRAPVVTVAFALEVAAGRYRYSVVGGLVRLVPRKISRRNRFFSLVIS